MSEGPALREHEGTTGEPDRSVLTGSDRRRRGLWACLIALVVLVHFLNRWGEFTPDTVHELYLAPGRRLVHDLFSWETSPSLGRTNIDVGLLPVDVLMWALRSIGIPAWALVRLWHVVLLVGGGWGAVRLVDRLSGGRAPEPARFAAAIVYVANPFVVAGASTTPVLLPYALLPWLILTFAGAVEDRRGWRKPAAFGLVFFLMGGQHAGVVPLFLLLAVPCYGLYAVIGERRPLGHVVTATWRCAVLVVAVSAYWIVPAFLGRDGGIAVARTTESTDAVSFTSSFAEVLRLLGMWTLYGRQGDKLFQPNLASYLTNPFVVVATFAVPAAAFLSAWRARVRARSFGILLVAVGVPVMVGLFPVDSPSPFGRLIEAAFRDIPGAIAFRTTNKIGPLVALGYTILIAAGVAAVAPRIAGWRSRARVAATAAALTVLAVGVYPAWSGDLFPRGLDVPDYWHEAADALNSGPDSQRVLMLPGEALANYRWGIDAAQDVGPFLLSRPFVHRSTVHDGSVFASNFLAALDVPLNAESMPAGGVSAMARYLGAGDVLVRNDMAWEETNGAPPASVVRQVVADPRLELAGTFGAPGENTVGPTTSPSAAEDRTLPPLQRFALAGAQDMVRAERTSRTVLIDGDNFAVPELAAMNVLTGSSPFRFVADLSAGELGQALSQGARLAITDTNRRRRWSGQRTGEGHSATLSAGEALELEGDRPSLTLFPERLSAQSVAVAEGVRSVSASQTGSVFGLGPQGKPVLAFDGDDTTSWIAGDFGSAKGQSVTLQLRRPRRISRLTIQPLGGDGIAIESARVRVGNVEVPVFFDPLDPAVDVTVPPTTASSVVIEIIKLRGVGSGPVGITEVVIPGVRAVDRVQMPSTLAQLATRLDPAGRRMVAEAPLDVVMTRQSNRPASPFDDEEVTMRRRFSLPVDRQFSVSGQVRAGAKLSEVALDRAAGVPLSITASSSSRLFDGLGVRASLTLDGDPVTAWVPGGREPGEFVDLRFPPIVLDRVTIAQDVPPGATGVAHIRRVEITTDNGPPVVAELGANPSTVAFPPRATGRVRITVQQVDGDGTTVRISEIGIPGLPPLPVSFTTPLTGCVTVATVDGRPVRGALVGTVADVTSNQPVQFTSCQEEQLALTRGSHLVDPAPGWTLDRLQLRAPGRGEVDVGRSATVAVVRSSPTRVVIDTTAAGAPYFLVAGQSFNSRWRASMDGRSLGAPILVDGYSSGWRIDDTRPHRIILEYRSQRSVGLAMLGSAVTVGVLIAVLLRGRRRVA